MVHTLTPAADLGVDIDDVARLLTADGERIADSVLDPWIADVDAAQLRALYRDMVVLRRIDAEGVALQRQGQLGLWAPCTGQEATQIGTARGLREDDFTFPSYREIGVVYARGGRPSDFVLSWRGEAHSTLEPATMHSAVPQIIIGAQTLHAVGYAMGIQRDGTDQVSATYFGDGASSQGDVNESFVWAAAENLPIVYFCQNNQWAISAPVTTQSRVPIYHRAGGFGFPGVRIDGNDVLASLAVTRKALDQARAGLGPTLIEAYTYRMNPHTTSDDPTRYRLAAETETWKLKDPIARVRAYLTRHAHVGQDFFDAIDEESEQLAEHVRAGCRALPDPDPLSVFEHVHVELTDELREQRDAFAAYLDSFEEVPA